MALSSSTLEEAAAIGSSRRSRYPWSCPDGIMVCARARPLTSGERADPNVQSAVECLQEELIVNVGMGDKKSRCGYSSGTKKALLQRYPFHRVFHHNASQEEVFHHACAGIVYGAMEGINGAVMAYGATGSGKTYSMFGGESSTLGVIFQASQLLMQERDRLLHESPEKCVKFTCSFVEVYKEEVYDLLHPLEGRSKLTVQDIGGDHSVINNNAEPFVLKGLSYVSPNEFKEFVEFVQRGLHNRAIACTKGNAQSSRSHAIVTIEVEVRHREEASRGTLARLRFCDLAGCERAAQHHTLKAQQEGAKINQSLLELGCVTQALVKRSKERLAGVKHSKVHVGWRGSKLTRLMRDCLEGNCRTAMLICVSPTSIAIDDTRRAMEFAMKAKEVQLSAKPNEYTIDTPEVAKEQARLIGRLRTCLINVGLVCKARGISPADLAAEGADRDFLMMELGMHSQGSLVPSTPLPPSARPAQAAELSPPRDVLAELQAAAPPCYSSASPLASSVTAAAPRATLGHTPTAPMQSSQRNAVSSSVMSAVPSPIAPTGMPATVAIADKAKYELLLERVMKIVGDKCTVYDQIKEKETARERIESRMRQLSVQLADHMARDAGNASSSNEPPPLSIVNADRELRGQRSDVEKIKEKLDDLARSVERAEGEFSKVRNQLQIDGSDFFTELILQRANSVESCSSLELLSAQYLQEKMSMERRLSEYEATQDKLKSVVYDLVKYCPTDAPERRQAAVALSFADMSRVPAASSMLDAFRSRLSELGFTYGVVKGGGDGGGVSSNPPRTTRGGSSFHILAGNGNRAAPSVPKRRTIVASPVATVEELCNGSTSANNSFAKSVTPQSGGGGGGSTKPSRHSPSIGSTPTASAATPSATAVAFGRSMTAFSSLSASLAASPAIFNTLRKNGPNRGGPPLNGGAESNAAPQKKPPVPFTSAAAAAAAAALPTTAASSSSLTVKTSSGGNTLLGQGDNRTRVSPSSGVTR